MINPDNITKIVRDTLIDMKAYDPTMETLIKGTFAIESKLTDLFNPSNDLHGLMMMDNADIKKTCDEYIRLKFNLKEMIWSVTGVEVTMVDDCTLQLECNTNIVFMVAILYAYYDSFNEDIRADSLEDIAKIYIKHYDKHQEHDVEEFCDTYKRIFIN